MSRTVTVNVIGMAEKDCRMIRNVLSLASTKEQSYRLVIDGRERAEVIMVNACLLYTSPSPRDRTRSRMPSSA